MSVTSKYREEWYPNNALCHCCQRGRRMNVVYYILHMWEFMDHRKGEKDYVVCRILHELTSMPKGEIVGIVLSLMSTSMGWLPVWEIYVQHCQGGVQVEISLISPCFVEHRYTNWCLTCVDGMVRWWVTVQCIIGKERMSTSKSCVDTGNSNQPSELLSACKGHD